MSASPEHATYEGSAAPSQEGRLQTPQEQGAIPETNMAGGTMYVDEDDIESQARSQRHRRDLLQQEIEIETME
jgi:hypothetical protein